MDHDLNPDFTVMEVGPREIFFRLELGHVVKENTILVLC